MERGGQKLERPPENLSNRQSAVLGYLQARGLQGGTDEEMAAAIEAPTNTVRPRRAELESYGYVIDSGEERRTAFGRMARVWIVTAGGMRVRVTPFVAVRSE